jgi:hypothetical protein
MFASNLQWFDWWRRAASLSWGNLGGLAAFNDPRQLRNAFLDDWRQRATEFMRSPEFLALMRFHLTLLTQPMMMKAAQMMAPPVR